MSETPNRFDPYTGDPIPDDGETGRPDQAGGDADTGSQGRAETGSTDEATDGAKSGAGSDGYTGTGYGSAEQSQTDTGSTGESGENASDRFGRNESGNYEGSYYSQNNGAGQDSQNNQYTSGSYYNQNAGAGQNSQNNQYTSGSYYNQNAGASQNSQNTSGSYYNQNASAGQNSQNNQYTSGSYYSQNTGAGQNSQNNQYRSGSYYSQNAGASQNSQNNQYRSGSYYNQNAGASQNSQNNQYRSGSYYGQNRTSGTPHPGYRDGRAPGLTPQEVDRRARTYGIVSLVCGICTIVFSFASMCCCPFISVLTGIAAIIFGIMARDSTGTRHGYGTAGFVTGIIGLVLTVLISIVMVTYVGSDNFRNGFEGQLKKYYNSEENDSNPFDGSDGSFTIPGQNGSSYRFTIPRGNSNPFGD